MKAHRIFSIFAVSMGLIYFTSSCTQNFDEMEVADSLTISAKDDAQAASISDDILNEVNIYIASLENANFQASKLSSESGNNNPNPSIAVDKADLVTFPKQITIDFGNDGVMGFRENTLKGKVTVSLNNKLDAVGTIYTITFAGFSINGNIVSGNQKITNTGSTAKTITEQLVVTKPDKTTIKRFSERTREWVGDNNTPLNSRDDLFLVKGTSTGTNTMGQSYSTAVTEKSPMIIGGGWPFFTKGIVTIRYGSRYLGLDFGNGEKDAVAFATTQGVTNELLLEK